MRGESGVRPRRATGRPLPPALRLFVAISLAISCCAWALCVALSVLDISPGLLPFVGDGHHFADFWVFFSRFQHLHTPAFFAPGQFHFSYFPAGVPLYAAFYRFGLDAGIDLYFALCSACVLAGAVVFARALMRAGLRGESAALLLVVSSLCAFPVIFAVERGNLELLLAVGVTCGVWAFCTGRRTVAALLWGVFGAVKLYPLLLAGVFLVRRRWLGSLLLTLVTAAVVTLLSLAYTGPTLVAAWTGLRGGTAEFLADYTLRIRATEWDHSLFGVVKVFAMDHGYAVAPLLMAYFVIAGTSMLLLYLLRMRRLPMANQIVALSVSLVLLPPTSFEYTLTEMYGAWGVLVWLAVTTAGEARSVRGLRPALGVMAALFSPLRMVLWHGVSYGGQLQCVLLVVLLGIALREPWPALPVEGAGPAGTGWERRPRQLDVAGAGATP